MTHLAARVFARHPQQCAVLIGSLGASAALSALLLMGLRSMGVELPPSLHTERFQIAVLAGPKQSAQVAPENAIEVSEAVITVPTARPDSKAVSAQRETSLPDAVRAAQDGAVSPDRAQPDEVLPPARVAMPGGKLVALEDQPRGDTPDPFAIAPHQVYLRLLVNTEGRVVRGGVIRSGGEPMRDALILRAIQSRSFDTSKLIPLGGKEPLWQMDLVIDYGTEEFLP